MEIPEAHRIQTKSHRNLCRDLIDSYRHSMKSHRNPTESYGNLIVPHLDRCVPALSDCLMIMIRPRSTQITSDRNPKEI